MAVVTEADLCNQALANVGHTQFITALTETSTAAKVCSVQYPQARDAQLETFDWQWARWHAVLAQLSDVTRHGWQYFYSLPTNLLAARYVWAGARPGAPLSSLSPVANPWSIVWSGMPYGGVGRRIAYGLELSDDGTKTILGTDLQGAELIYTAQLEAVPVFPPLFKEALITRLTAKLFLSLVKERALHDTWMKRADQQLKEAYASQLRQTQEDPARDAEAISVRG